MYQCNNNNSCMPQLLFFFLHFFYTYGMYVLQSLRLIQSQPDETLGECVVQLTTSSSNLNIMRQSQHFDSHKLRCSPAYLLRSKLELLSFACLPVSGYPCARRAKPKQWHHITATQQFATCSLMTIHYEYIFSKYVCIYACICIVHYRFLRRHKLIHILDMLVQCRNCEYFIRQL